MKIVGDNEDLVKGGIARNRGIEWISGVFEEIHIRIEC